MVFTRKVLVLVISVWFPPATSMTTRTFCLGLLVCCALVFECWLAILLADCGWTGEHYSLPALLGGTPALCIHLLHLVCTHKMVPNTDEPLRHTLVTPVLSIH